MHTCCNTYHPPNIGWVCQVVLRSIVMEHDHTNLQLLMNLHWCVALCMRKTNHTSNPYIFPTVLSHCCFHLDVMLTPALSLFKQVFILPQQLLVKHFHLRTFTVAVPVRTLLLKQPSFFLGIISNFNISMYVSVIQNIYLLRQWFSNLNPFDTKIHLWNPQNKNLCFYILILHLQPYICRKSN
jgi:hypothetical protein